MVFYRPEHIARNEKLMKSYGFEIQEIKSLEPISLINDEAELVAIENEAVPEAGLPIKDEQELQAIYSEPIKVKETTKNVVKRTHKKKK